MADPIAEKVLLVGWDAADWQLIHPLMDAGRMPNLKHLVETGVMGNLLTMQPVLSPILWTSIATGKRAYQHGITGFVEATPDGAGLRPTASTTRKCKALWNILAQSGKRCHAIGWYASHPAEAIRGVCVSHQFPVAPASAHPGAWPPQPNSVEPSHFAEQLADLRMHPQEVTGPMLSQFIPAAAQLDQRDPEVRYLLNAFAKRLAECISLHAVVTALLEHEPWDFCTAYYEAIDHIGHDFMPFHPPRTEHVREDLFAVFRGVMDATYELHDQMLGRLLELAGPNAHIMLVSDHGFRNGELRPPPGAEPAQWHRNFGVFVCAGAGIRKDEVVHGATLLDIAPTILTLFGLPVGRDMEGKVLVNAFEQPPKIERIASWEDVPDPTGATRRASDVADDPEAAAAALQQLVELGYIEAPGADVQRDIARARAEQKFNLACTYIDGKQPAQALRLAQDLADEFPEEVRYRTLTGQAAVSTGNAEALQQAITALERLRPEHRQMLLFRGFHAWLTDDVDGALASFQEAAAHGPRDPWVLCRIGRAFLRLQKWADAERAFLDAAALDPENAEVYYGLSVALPRQGKLEEGVECGLRAISLLHDFPLAHFQLGAVLSRLGWYERALQAFEICLMIRPDFAAAHNYVSRVAQQLGRLELAERHRLRAEAILEQGLPQPVVD
ncbi:MAG: alkaline phosphatase family protein [Verrucomicrobiota bacterium]|nr:alkaline phosphatase family protein [Verrucomicrobiota bacterium]